MFVWLNVRYAAPPIVRMRTNSTASLSSDVVDVDTPSVPSHPDSPSFQGALPILADLEAR